MAAIHLNLSGGYVDNIGWIQADDPALGEEASLVKAGRCWLDITTANYPILKVRNSANTAWDIVGTVSSEGGALAKYVAEGTQVVQYVSLNGTDWVEAGRTETA